MKAELKTTRRLTFIFQATLKREQQQTKHHQGSNNPNDPKEAGHQQRQAAAGALRLAVDEPGHVVTLFRLTVDTSIPAALSLRQAAAINVKNIIGRRWSRSTHLAFRTIFSDISERAASAAGTSQRSNSTSIEPRCSASHCGVR